MEALRDRINRECCHLDIAIGYDTVHCNDLQNYHEQINEILDGKSPSKPMKYASVWRGIYWQYIKKDYEEMFVHYTQPDAALDSLASYCLAAYYYSLTYKKFNTHVRECLARAISNNKYAYLVLFWICRYVDDLNKAVQHGVVEAVFGKTRKEMNQQLADECEIFLSLGYHYFAFPLVKYYHGIGPAGREKFFKFVEIGINNKDIETLFFIAGLMNDKKSLTQITNIALTYAKKDTIRHYSHEKMTLLSGFDEFNPSINYVFALVYASDHFKLLGEMKIANNCLRTAADSGEMLPISLYLSNYFEDCIPATDANAKRLVLVEKYLKGRRQIGYYLLKYILVGDFNILLDGFKVFDETYCENCNFCDECMCKLILERIFESYGMEISNTEEYVETMRPYIKFALERYNFSCLFTAATWFAYHGSSELSYTHAIAAINIVGIKSKTATENLAIIAKRDIELVTRIYKYYSG